MGGEEGAGGGGVGVTLFIARLVDNAAVFCVNTWELGF